MLGACLFALSACDSKDDPTPDAGPGVDAGTDAGSDAGSTEQPPPVIPEGHTLLTPSPERQTLAWDGAVKPPRLAFVARSGRHYDFAAEARQQGYVLTLRDAAGVTLDQFDPRPGFPFTWHWSGLTEGAVYTVELSQGPSAAGEAWVFRFLDQGLDDHGDLPLTASPWGALEQPLTGLGEHSGERDVLSFATVADHVYAIDCTFPAQDWQLYFFNLEGANYSVVNSDAFAQTQAATAFKSQGGLHLVSIQDLRPAPSSETYSCVLRDKGLEDHGNLFNTGTQLPQGTTSAQGKLDYIEDVDVFDLGVLPGHFYRASCTLEGPTPCNVHAEHGSDQTDPHPSVTFKAEQSRHFVWAQGDRVVPARWTALPYTLQFEDLGTDDHGDSTYTATPLKGLSQTVQARFFVLNDHDVFSFQTVEGQRYQFSSPWREGQEQVFSFITTEQGSAQVAPRTHVGSNWVQTFTAPATGTYFVEFRAGIEANLGDYTFQFEALTP
ncbi:hypothetical protein D7W81_08040 [Corallococcus aberystwythensis]|uniref:Lipoprotein n=2 Tax=Corallococcus aberystwythensis TaxID=2316722 RepID=A0A3A8QQZ6_9BACT|nr:hypothetical protein D7W81_08040 [Corallococcus aberystwythensis]